MNNYFDETDGNIRAPDKAHTECLNEDDRSDYEKQVDEAMYLSIQEFRKQEEINKKYEDDILHEHNNITKKRREQFSGLLFNLHKIIRFDKDIKEIYEIIEPIIDAYCEQYIKKCEIDSLTYDRIFKIISNFRTDKKNIELLKTIIIKV